MAKHWQEAQEEAHAKSGTNVVQNGNVVLIGNPARGWRIVTPKQSLEARTARGVELILEELEVAPLGWS